MTMNSQHRIYSELPMASLKANGDLRFLGAKSGHFIAFENSVSNKSLPHILKNAIQLPKNDTFTEINFKRAWD